jgi:hypothetical protein
MPCISMFYGILIYMYPKDNKQHHEPHVHVIYQEFNAVFSIKTGQIIAGNLPSKKNKLVELWIDMRQDELLADWYLAINGEKVFNIKPLEIS